LILRQSVSVTNPAATLDKTILENLAHQDTFQTIDLPTSRDGTPSDDYFPSHPSLSSGLGCHTRCLSNFTTLRKRVKRWYGKKTKGKEKLSGSRWVAGSIQWFHDRKISEKQNSLSRLF
jgi:hypothetical protein